MRILSIVPRFTVYLGITLGIFNVLFSYAENVPSDRAENTDDEYIFDSRFFRGDEANKKALLQLSKGDSVLPGTYGIDLYVNNNFVENTSIPFIEVTGQKAEPCFTAEQLIRANILVKIPNITATDTTAKQCEVLSYFVGQSAYRFDFSRLRLDLSIPNTSMKQVPRGYVPAADLSAGSSIAFINYLANYYYSEYKNLGTKTRQDSGYLSLNTGVNFGQWQFRQQSSISSNDQGTDWNVIRSYVKRPITSLQSELALGQLSSTGRFFSGLSFNGLNLRTDDRMLPESMRGYAPVVQGIAKTTAIVSVMQNGREIYQTTVAAGPFKISDLYATNYNGDLDVIVTEADGSHSSFRVPFSAVPESVRQGTFKYNFDIGRTRDIGEDTYFTNITTQYGLSNAITLNNGLRVADGYVATMFGTAYTNFIGAFSTDVTYSRSKLPGQDNVDGWMFGVNYSKTFQATNTTLALAGYRFSTEGYYDLSNVIALRKSIRDGNTFQSNTLHEYARTTLMLNQNMGRIGSLYLSGSASSYRDEKPDDYQLQLGYSKAFNNGVSMNISVAKQQRSDMNTPFNLNQNLSRNGFTRGEDTSFGVSFNFPLSKQKFAQSAQLTYNHSNSQDAYQASLLGAIDHFKNTNYTLGVSYDDNSNVSVWNAGLSKRFNNVSSSFNASKGENYWQTSANVQGAVALHSGGMTWGPYLSDTFGLVEAKGAQGARLLNGHDTKINRQGYALVSALTPYRYNTVALDPEGMSTNAELEVGTANVAPYAGAAIKIIFKTIQGFAVLIQSKLQDGSNVPLGADVQNEDAAVIGMVGQGGQVYLRTQNKSGKLKIQWSDQRSDTCFIRYTLPEAQLSQAIIKISQPCIAE